MVRGSTTRRAAVGLIALTAILLQGLVAAMAPLWSLDTDGAIICAETPTSQDAPGNPAHREHSACCILACAASGLVFLAAAFALVDFPTPRCDRVDRGPDYRAGAPSPLKLFFAARGPPRIA